MEELRELLNGKMSWLKDLSEQNILMHNDLDAILSVGFLEKYAKLKNVVGIYDNSVFYAEDTSFLKDINIHNCIGVDLDFMIPKMKTLGHHITGLLKTGENYNVNDLCEITKNISQIGFSYGSKYPLNEIIFLYSLFGLQPETDNEIALLVYADSVFKNYVDYRLNVRSWLKRLGQTNILNALDTRSPDIYGIIASRIIPLTKCFGGDEPHNQFQITGYNKDLRKKMYIGKPQFLINFINKNFGWDMNILPDKLSYTRQLYYHEFNLGNSKDDEKIGLLLEYVNDKLQGKEEIYSASLTKKNELKITSKKKFSLENILQTQ